MMMENLCSMILNMDQLLTIYNRRNLFISLFVVLIALFSFLPVEAVQSGRVEHSAVLFDYSKLDKDAVLNEAEFFFYNGETAQNKDERLKNFDLAMGKYQLLTKIDSSQVYPYVQLARIYDEKLKDRLAKEYFFRATNLSPRDPYANFYFGEFFFKRNNYKRALNYYRIAYNSGYDNNYDLNLKLGTIYEKFADLMSAKQFYEASLKINPQNAEIQNRVNAIDALNYQSSEYYYFIRE